MKKACLKLYKILFPAIKHCYHPRKTLMLCVAFSSMLDAIANEKIFAQNIHTVKLRVEKSFPDEKDDKVFMSYPINLDMDESGNIYISDQYLSSLLKFSPSGEWLASISKPGHGPGEFTNQTEIRYYNGKIYINDQANRRIQWMTPEGRYLGEFKVIEIPKRFTLHQGKIYALNLNSYLHWSSEKQKPNDLIWVLDEKGKRISAFGDHLDFDKNLSPPDNLAPSVSDGFIDIFDEHVYLLFNHYPILRIYTLAGELQKTIRFEGMNYAKRVPGNYEWKNFQRKIEKLPFKALFNAFNVNKQGIFIEVRNFEGFLIDQFDHAGNFGKRYSKEKKGKESYFRDFIVIPLAGGKAKFLILTDEDDVPRVDICVE